MDIGSLLIIGAVVLLNAGEELKLCRGSVYRHRKEEVSVLEVRF